MPDHDDFQPLDLSDYEIHSRREITNILRNLSECNQLIQLRIEDSADTIVTSVLAVDESAGHVVIDCASSPTINQRIIASEHLYFETVLNNIRILFQTSGAAACQFQGGPALQTAIPPVLVRLQRREFYRMPTPTATPLLCEIRIGEKEGTRILTLPLQNISGGGIAIMDEQKLLNPAAGFIYPDCRIQLPAGTLLQTALEICNARDITLANGKNTRRLGCRFVHLPSAMLNAVQRYITSLEREQNAKNTGLS
ncbi:MAG TPA: flagellar brake protein [Burkholderiaceae bacterium]|nr:flagellar brake protein [Burkholderiaceae bacterium]